MGPKRTPLHDRYADHGARVVEFAGWSMPVQFGGGVIAEHRAVREAAGLFDVGHMARLEVSGSGAEAFLDRLLTNNVCRLAPGTLFYTALCQEDGGTIDDLVVYRHEDRFWVVANAANRDAVWAWFDSHAGGDVSLRDRTSELGHLAIQGPESQAILHPLLDVDLEPLGYYQFLSTTWRGTPLVASRNGYTGEDGFELYIASSEAVALWDALLEAGRDRLSPAGLGARDTLRLEVAYALYGNELSRAITPIEADLGWTVKLKGRAFIGHERLREQKARGVERTLVGLEFDGRIIGRQGAAIHHGDLSVGEVTSGTFGPSVQKGIALAYVPPDLSAIGTVFSVEVRGREIPARIVPRPFYTKGTHR
jgi:aminomethyltransferase